MANSTKDEYLSIFEKKVGFGRRNLEKMDEYEKKGAKCAWDSY